MNPRREGESRLPAPPDLYCPRCRRSSEPGERLCYDCGETMRPSGYCPICERSSLADPGDLCPKHDVELLDGPIEPDFDASTSRLVTVANYGVTSEALGPKLRLEAEGIPAFLQDARMGENAIYQVATGGVSLQVPEELAAEARVLLSQSWKAPVDDDDPWEGLEPEPAERRKSIMKIAIWVYLLGPITAVVIVVLLAYLSRAF